MNISTTVSLGQNLLASVERYQEEKCVWISVQLGQKPGHCTVVVITKKWLLVAGCHTPTFHFHYINWDLPLTYTKKFQVVIQALQRYIHDKIYNE